MAEVSWPEAFTVVGIVLAIAYVLAHVSFEIRMKDDNDKEK